VLDLTPAPWEAAVHRRLNERPPNVEALLELFDLIAPEVWGYALHRCRDPRTAAQVAIKAFLAAAQNPAIFDDRRIPLRVRMLLLVHLDTPQHPRRGRWLRASRSPIGAGAQPVTAAPPVAAPPGW
jgi:hypothetical protein